MSTNVEEKVVMYVNYQLDILLNRREHFLSGFDERKPKVRLTHTPQLNVCEAKVFDKIESNCIKNEHHLQLQYRKLDHP